MERPHVVILGAGASKQAFPSGDKNARLVPLMNELVQCLGIKDILEEENIRCETTDFEQIYSILHEKSTPSTLRIIEEKVFNYFSELELLEEPTLYDHLVLSLREKDCIATFNWDPLLYLAWRRNHENANLPTILFLHGNVAIGLCENCKVLGDRNGQCLKCHRPYTKSKLLYPILKKNYMEPFIQAEWEQLKDDLKNAYMLTVFGYGAPHSDVEAKRLMEEAWGPKEKRNLEQTEIIDIKAIKEEEQLLETWKPFILEHHRDVHSSFYDSSIAKHPRRTCEAFWAQSMELQRFGNRPIPKNEGWEGINKWLKLLTVHEKTT